MNRDPKFRFIKEEFILSILKQPNRRKEVLMLFRQNTQKETAVKLNIEENTVSKHISNFCKEFRLAKYFEDYSIKELPKLLKQLLNQYIDNIVAEEIRKSISLKKNEINRKKSLNNQRGKILIVLDMDKSKIDVFSVLSYLNNLKLKNGDDSMKIEKIEDGSIRLTITGTVEGCQRIKDLFDAGELTEILDIPVLDVSPVDLETEENLWTNLRNWLQSNILPGWELEEIVSGTIAALKANPDFSTTPAFGLLLDAHHEEVSNTLIPELLSSLNHEDINIVRLAAQRLGEIEANTPEVINQLKEKSKVTDDIETEWQIALTLGKIAPEEYPNAKAQKQTLELGDTSLELILAIKNDEDDFVDILVEIRPDWEDYLPTGLEVKILEESGEDFWQDDFVSTQSVTDEQSYIYFSFWGTPGDKFILQIRLENAVLQEHFKV